MNLYIFRRGSGEAPLQLSPQLASAVEMAAHVRANVNFRLGRGREMKMRIKTRDAVNLVQRSLRTLGKPFELRLGQEPVAKLDAP